MSGWVLLAGGLMGCPTIENINENHTVVRVESCCCNDCCDTGCPVGDSELCDDYEPPFPEALDTNVDCGVTPGPVPMDPVVEWQWPAAGAEETYDQVMMTPVVAPLRDTDGDGATTGNDIPVVVFHAFDTIESGGLAGWYYKESGALIAVDGATGVELFRKTGEGAVDTSTMCGMEFCFSASGGIALGDIDADGSPDICAAGYNVPLICLEGDGTLKWTAAAGEIRWFGSPAMADLDADGKAEVVLGNVIYDHTGALMGVGDYGWAGLDDDSAESAVVDLNADGVQEVLGGDMAYTPTGAPFWGAMMVNANDAAGPVAVGDFDGSGVPQVFTLHGASGGSLAVTTPDVQVRAADGAVVQEWNLVDTSSSQQGGAPVVADFDGDGLPEVGIAGKYNYVAYEADGTEIWRVSNNDASSHRTGSSAFDFEGDGVVEVIYADQDQLFILDGATGANRLDPMPTTMDPSAHCAGTLNEYPSIADVDGDGSTEILLASTNYSRATACPDTEAPWNGVRAIGSATQAWMPSRPVWNQFAYSISNVNDDGSIPASPVPNWTVWNNFRQQESWSPPAARLPNLYPLAVDYCAETCAEGYLELYLVIANNGLVAATNFEVTLRDDGTLVHSETVAALDAGTSMVLGPVLMDASMWSGDLTLTADAGFTVNECDEADNMLDLGQWPCT